MTNWTDHEKIVTSSKYLDSDIKTSIDEKDLQTLQKIFILIKNRTGQDFSLYKKNTIKRRIMRRMNIYKFEETSQYFSYLKENQAEVDQLYKELLINVTQFFRDPEAYSSLKAAILKNILREKSDRDIIRIWIPGCSSGEEVYSVAIIFKELFEEMNQSFKVQIFGTDLEENAIKTARTGKYSNIAGKIGSEQLQKYFYKKEDYYIIKNEIREMVIFATHNVITDPPFIRLDMISCRNLLIYLETKAQNLVLSNFKYALNKDGILFLGPSENIGDFFDSFSLEDNKWKIFKYIKVSRSELKNLNSIHHHTQNLEDI